MKLAAFLATFACIGVVAASHAPIPTRVANPNSSLVKRGTQLFWDSVDAYQNHPHHKERWETICHQVLTEEGCGVGILYKGHGRTKRNNQRLTYIKVKAAPSLGMLSSDMRKMRIFEDGSSVDGWSGPMIQKQTLNPPRESKTKHLEKDPLPHGSQALLFWDPPSAYKDTKRRRFWERRCGGALVKHGCDVGLIHQGEVYTTTPNGEETSYISVDGAPLMDMENSRKMSVFQDVSTQDGWSAKGRRVMRIHKRPKKDLLHPLEGQTAVLSWDPEDSYINQPRRRLYWEQRCHLALHREGCTTGILHKGETRSIKDGQETTYINVEGAPLPDMKNSKYMHVFQDGSSDIGWSHRDEILMSEARRGRLRTLRSRPQEGPDQSD